MIHFDLMTRPCYCCSGASFESCCQPFLMDERTPSTPELLMRSRYSAYCTGNMSYIERTMQGRALVNFKMNPVIGDFASSCKWTGLQVIKNNPISSIRATVEFKAHYTYDGAPHILHEISTFEYLNHKWMYMDGIILS